MAPQGIHGFQVWAMAPSFPSLATSMACEQSGPGGRDGLSKNCQVTSAESAKRHQQWSVRNKVVRPVPAAQGSSGVDILVPRAPENSPTDLKVEATGSLCPWQVRGEVRGNRPDQHKMVLSTGGRKTCQEPRHPLGSRLRPEGPVTGAGGWLQ